MLLTVFSPDQVRISINVEEWKRLGDRQFEEHFRMDRCTFEVFWLTQWMSHLLSCIMTTINSFYLFLFLQSLLVAVGSHLENHGRLVRQTRKGLDFSLMMVLWILASPDTFRSVGVKFGVSKQTVHFHYRYIIEAVRVVWISLCLWLHWRMSHSYYCSTWTATAICRPPSCLFHYLARSVWPHSPI